MARTRIPTPYGQAFLHLYRNNKDDKEHLAIVVDPAQFMEGEVGAHLDTTIPAIRSRSLDAVWHSSETAMERITRGAFVGRLSVSSHVPSKPLPQIASKALTTRSSAPPPLVRIHSECFTGETIGSMRCDCGEQLDEAIRLIFQPITITSRDGSSTSKTIPGRGVVVYLRQEGRGIGLLSKIRAYNLQDLGHDTVSANILLGHKPDERGYEMAGAILRDLGFGKDGSSDEGLRLLTNNPSKVDALEKEGLRINERVPMVPKSWRRSETGDKKKHVHPKSNEGGVSLINGGYVYGQDLDRYIRTKVLKMGHMLPLVNDDGVDVELDSSGMIY
jgi:GTP cyclohydrolase II